MLNPPKFLSLNINKTILELIKTYKTVHLVQSQGELLNFYLKILKLAYIPKVLLKA